MTRLFVAGAALAVMLAAAGLAEAQTLPPYPVLSPPPFDVRPALPETMPTWSSDDMSGTARHDIAATPSCGAANPQGGIPSMFSGTCH
jgi:hypothetical protein